MIPPRRTIIRAHRKPINPSARKGTEPGWVLHLECGHTKEVKHSEFPLVDWITCPGCKFSAHIPLNLEARLKSLK